MTPAEIGNLGERYVTKWLESKGYSCYRNTQQPGSTDIEARSSSKNILVQVKTGVAPSVPPTLSGDEKRNISSRASRLGYEAWTAQVQIDNRGNQAGDIAWSKLN